ncbi:MAG: hypothetical protein D6768_09940 [Chloroflexi bacterium]|nr:MAG: hypothetical protein D6768_09940 [Chloroflexota bacterium]
MAGARIQNPESRVQNPETTGQSTAPVHHSPFTIRHSPFIWLTLLLSLPALAPLLQPGYYWGAHDARHSVYFLYEFNKAIQDGIWYPRWAPDFAFGYGYPFFNIYGPLSSYTGEFLHLAGFDIVTAVKIVFGLSVLLSGLTMFLFVRRLLGPRAGLVSALVYVYLPYHLFDLYVRAALAESVGFVFIPLVLWGFFEAVTRPRLAALVWAALAYAGLMFTSNLLALLFTPILGLYVAVMLLWQVVSEWRMPNGESPEPSESPHHTLRRNSAPHPNLRFTFYVLRLIKAGLAPLGVLLLGLGVSAIFWLPAILEYKYVRVDQWVGGRFAFGDDFVELFQLFSPKWGFGASIPGPDDDTGFQLGLAALLLFVLSFWLVPRLADARIRRSFYLFQAVTILLIFLTTPASYGVWAVLPLSTFAQFPWRLLVVIAPFLAVTAGAVMAGEPPVNEQLAVSNEQAMTSEQISSAPLPPGARSLFPVPYSLIILCALILLSSYPYIRAEVRPPKPTEGPVSQAALFRFQQSSDEMTGQTAWVRRIPTWSTLAEQVIRGGQIDTKVNYTALPADQSVGVYSMEMDSVHELLWVGTEKEGQVVTFFVPYYPGWTATIYQDLGPHDGNLDREKGPVTRIGPPVSRPQIRTTPVEGWMQVPIPTGSHFLELRFEDTPVRVAGRWITFVSLLLAMGLLVWGWGRWK